ncbi:MAG: hypothetical protein LW688_09355 [Cryomorphaceae bacterium]|jgi:hypothetical protein|nr:hypothetical protein [Cryomorphaceae bacterium]
MKHILYLTLLGFVWSSCADLDRDKQLAEIKILTNRTDSLEVALKEHRIDTLASIQNSFNSLELRIRNNYTADTISIVLGQKMDEFRTLKKFFMAKHEEEGEEEKEEKGTTINLNEQTLGSAYATLRRGIQHEKKTLNALMNDVQNGFGKRDKYNDYIQFETEKIRQLGVLLEDYKTHKNTILKRFESVRSDLNNFASKLEQKKALEKAKLR